MSSYRLAFEAALSSSSFAFHARLLLLSGERATQSGRKPSCRRPSSRTCPKVGASPSLTPGNRSRNVRSCWAELMSILKSHKMWWKTCTRRQGWCARCPLRLYGAEPIRKSDWRSVALFGLLHTSRSYLQTSALLAGDVNLTAEERKHFCQEILTFAGKSGDKRKCTCGLSG